MTRFEFLLGFFLILENESYEVCRRLASFSWRISVRNRRSRGQNFGGTGRMGSRFVVLLVMITPIYRPQKKAMFSENVPQSWSLLGTKTSPWANEPLKLTAGMFGMEVIFSPKPHGLSWNFGSLTLRGLVSCLCCGTSYPFFWNLENTFLIWGLFDQPGSRGMGFFWRVLRKPKYPRYLPKMAQDTYATYVPFKKKTAKN